MGLTSQTSRNQTLVSVQDPSQWMPSSWFFPMITLLSDAPSCKMNTAFSSPIQLAPFVWTQFLCGHTSIIITVAGSTTIVLPIPQINTAFDHTGRRQRDNITHTRGNVECLGTGNANETEDDSAGMHFELMVDQIEGQRGTFYTFGDHNETATPVSVTYMAAGVLNIGEEISVKIFDDI